jgi:thiamine pyrophosphate-dependent acetolactate synthase large subunit-like protein
VDTVSDHLVAILTEWRVDTVFGLPGDGINGLVEAFRKAQDRIRAEHYPVRWRLPSRHCCWRCAAPARRH